MNSLTNQCYYFHINSTFVHIHIMCVHNTSIILYQEHIAVKRRREILQHNVYVMSSHAKNLASFSTYTYMNFAVAAVVLQM